MHHYSRNNENRSYSYLSSTTSIPSQNAHYQYYNFRLPTQQSLYSNTTSIVKYTSPHSQLSRNITDLVQSISAFDNYQLPIHHQSTIPTFPSIYIPSNSSRRTSVSDSRLATASAMRERLLTDIQNNINEIDQEISLLERRTSYLHYTPSRLSSISTYKKPSLLNNNQLWPDKPKRIYEVIPRIPSEDNSISKFTDQTASLSYIGQYHYGPEVEENEIAENDPENSDRKSIIHEISEYNFQEPFSLDKYYHEQSPLPHDRALIFVPEYVDDNKIESNQIAEDISSTNHPIDINTAQLTTVKSSNYTGSSNKLNIEDFQSLVQTAPKSLTTEKRETNSINTILSTPVQHTRLSRKIEETHTSPSSQQTNIETKKNTNIDTKYFFSEFENEGEEDLISIDPTHLIIPTDLDVFPDDNISNIIIRQSQTSLLNPHTTEGKLILKENTIETESKKIDSKKKDIITSTSNLSTKIKDTKQPQLTETKSRVNQTQRKSLSSITSKNSSSEEEVEEEPSEKESMNILTDQPSSIQNTNRSITSSNTHTTSNRSRQNSPIPIPLNSPDVNDNRPSTSRSTTPERRKSISSLNQDVLLTSTEFIHFDNPSIDPFKINSERNIPSPLVNLNLESFNPDDLRLPSTSPHQGDISNVNVTSIEQKEAPLSPVYITDSQQRSKLSLSVHPPVSKEKSVSTYLLKIK